MAQYSGYDYLPLIVEKLKKLRPYKVILFGSYARGTSHPDSDIDLLVVLDTESIPQTFQEHLDNKIRVRNAVWDLSQEVPIDLLVYTRPMYRRFNQLDSMFAREIRTKGKVLYEADNA
ncbi:MAG: nucleotidyltransferase domain-containing protein [Calditrichaeota bacterium]|nr:MAG: nucleotidyltransferase domain-containing protein [Calditrichota bacterium]